MTQSSRIAANVMRENAELRKRLKAAEAVVEAARPFITAFIPVHNPDAFTQEKHAVDALTAYDKLKATQTMPE